MEGTIESTIPYRFSFFFFLLLTVAFCEGYRGSIIFPFIEPFTSKVQLTIDWAYKRGHVRLTPFLFLLSFLLHPKKGIAFFFNLNFRNRLPASLARHDVQTFLCGFVQTSE